MYQVLEKLKLGCFIDKFKEQKISPDIICKLSLQEFAMLGINNQQDIMALQIACSTYGEKLPAMLYSFYGAHQFLIPKSVLECWLDEDFTITEISRLLSVSESTVYRRMREYGLSKLQFTDISDQDLDLQVSNFGFPPRRL